MDMFRWRHVVLDGARTCILDSKHEGSQTYLLAASIDRDGKGNLLNRMTRLHVVPAIRCCMGSVRTRHCC